MKLRDSLAENKSIRLQAEAETWQDAVKIGVDLLVAADVVEPRYYQAILDAVEQHGPYFVLAPGLAMPHGRPEEGVKKTGFALVTLKKPLEFNHEDNDPVDILITMAAVDANTHQEVGIMQIVNLFEGTSEDAQKDGAELLLPTVDTVTYEDGISEEVNGFDVPVPALDEPFNLALIGTKGKWYDHEVIVSNPEKLE